MLSRNHKTLHLLIILFFLVTLFGCATNDNNDYEDVLREAYICHTNTENYLSKDKDFSDGYIMKFNIDGTVDYQFWGILESMTDLGETSNYSEELMTDFYKHEKNGIYYIYNKEDELTKKIAIRDTILTLVQPDAKDNDILKYVELDSVLDTMEKEVRCDLLEHSKYSQIVLMKEEINLARQDSRMYWNFDLAKFGTATSVDFVTRKQLSNKSCVIIGITFSKDNNSPYFLSEAHDDDQLLYANIYFQLENKSPHVGSKLNECFWLYDDFPINNEIITTIKNGETKYFLFILHNVEIKDNMSLYYFEKQIMELSFK